MTALLPLWHDDPYEERAPLAGRARDRRARDRRRHRRASPAPGTWPSAASTAPSSRRGTAAERGERPQRRLPRGRAPRPPIRTRSALFGHDVAVGIYRATLASEQRIYEIAEEIGAARALRARRLPAGHLGARGARARARPVRGDAGRRPPRRVGRRGRSARDRAPARPRRRVLAARRDDAPGALGAGVLARDRGARRAHLRAQPRSASRSQRCAQRRLRRARGRRDRARPARGRRGRRRAAAARAALRAERAHEAAAHDRDGADRRAPRALRDRRPLGLRVPAAAARRPHRGGRVLGSRRRGRGRLVHDGRGGRRPRSTPASSASCATIWASRRRSRTAGSGWSGTRATSARSSAPCPEQDGLFVAGGYNGTGNLNGFTAGRIVSELLATGQSADARLYDSARPLMTA